MLLIGKFFLNPSVLFGLKVRQNRMMSIRLLTFPAQSLRPNTIFLFNTIYPYRVYWTTYIFQYLMSSFIFKRVDKTDNKSYEFSEYPLWVYFTVEKKMASYLKDKKEIMVRLRKLEGQLKGIQRMVEGEKYCVDVLNQLSAVVGATQKVAAIILKDHIQGCIRDALIQNESADHHVDELLTVIERFTNKK
jgi:DNA-binding FrmR family transcriptional regulator